MVVYCEEKYRGEQMKILALGTGSAFTLNNYQTSFLIDDELLFDCGGDIRFALKE